MSHKLKFICHDVKYNTFYLHLQVDGVDDLVKLSQTKARAMIMLHRLRVDNTQPFGEDLGCIWYHFR